jgi:hypothetical protein
VGRASFTLGRKLTELDVLVKRNILSGPTSDRKKNVKLTGDHESEWAVATLIEGQRGFDLGSLGRRPFNL